jgi:acetyl-CoA carboxylase carboxyl transferase subunit beta
MPGGDLHYSAMERVALVADEGSFEPFDDSDIAEGDPLVFCDRLPYPARLREARRRTGSAEAVVTGACRAGGRPLVLIASEFGFLGGSLGIATAERIVRAFERAAALRAPVLALVATGGSRMQEGTLALVQMPRLADAVARFRRGGGLYISYLMHPTTGGALASVGSLGSVMLAQPGALVGFAGPRTVEGVGSAPIVPEAQRAETLRAAGWIDDLVEPAHLRTRVAALLRILDSREQGTAGRRAPRQPDAQRADGHDAWEDLRRARDTNRFGVRDLLGEWQAPIFELRGDRGGRSDDPACLAAIARIAGRPAVLVAHDRSARGGAVRPAGLAKARRALRLAEELELPVVLMIDTPGAQIDEAAEREGLAGEIALTLQALADVDAPAISVLLGQGGSGAAVAFLSADGAIALARAGLWVVAPEAASAILFRDRDHAPALARMQGGSATHLLDRGIVAEVVAEQGGLAAIAAALEVGIDVALADLECLDPSERRARRQRRLHGLGPRPIGAVPAQSEVA